MECSTNLLHLLFAVVLDPVHPGEILFEEFMRPMGLSMNRLARGIGVPVGRISEIIRETDPYGRPIYWVGPAGTGQDAGPGTDFHAIAENAAAVTPLKVDLTRHEAIGDIASWLEP